METILSEITPEQEQALLARLAKINMTDYLVHVVELGLEPTIVGILKLVETFYITGNLRGINQGRQSYAEALNTALKRGINGQ